MIKEVAGYGHERKKRYAIPMTVLFERNARTLQGLDMNVRNYDLYLYEISLRDHYVVNISCCITMSFYNIFLTL